MRWNPAKDMCCLGERRTRRGFLWWPLVMYNTGGMLEWRWLEWAKWQEQRGRDGWEYRSWIG